MCIWLDFGILATRWP